MRLWIENFWKKILIISTPVSLAWGCELKIPSICSISSGVIGQPRMRLWIEKQQALFYYFWVTGQPRMRLWIEKSMPLAYAYVCSGSASHEAVNWKVYLADETSGHTGSASHEAVNWKCSLTLSVGRLLQVSLAWGCELKTLLFVFVANLLIGQPRMRLWIENCNWFCWYL